MKSRHTPSTVVLPDDPGALLRLIALHHKGDKGVTALLIRSGLLQNQEVITGKDKRDSESAQTDSSTLSTGFFEYSSPFHFPIFCLKSIKTKPSDSEFTPSTHSVWSPDDATVASREVHDACLDKNALESPLTLWRKIRKALHYPKPGLELDSAELSKRIARLELVCDLPRLPLRQFPDEVNIVADYTTLQYGLVDDVTKLCMDAVAMLPESYVKTWVLENPTTDCWRRAGFAHQFDFSKRLFAPGSAVLLLSDHHSSGNTLINKYYWRQKIELWQYNGHKVCCLNPCADTTNWEKHDQLQVIPWGQQGELSKLQLQKLTAFLQTVRIIKGALLRHLVQALRLPAATEMRFWQQTFVYYDPGTDQGYVNCSADEDKQFLSDGLAKLSLNELLTLIAIVDPWLKSVNISIWHEFRVHLALLRPDWHCSELEVSRQYFTRMSNNLNSKSAHFKGNATFMLQTAAILGKALNNASRELKFSLANANLWCLENGLARGLIPELINSAQQLTGDNGNKVKKYRLYQKGDALFVRPGTQIQQTTMSLPVVAEFDSVEPCRFEIFSGNGNQQEQCIDAFDATYQVSPLLTNISLQSPGLNMTLKQYDSDNFWWATKVSVTSQGVVAETEHIKMIWPKDPHAINENTLNENSSFEFAKWDVKTGAPNRGSEGGMMCIKHNAPLWLHSNRPELDATGLVSRLEVNGVPFNLRYLPPGSFIMGSPDDEAERDNDETLHPVTLTKGFWMGATTVTQQLWQAVMADSSGGTGSDVNRSVANPSHFKAKADEELPVESVSWHDCQTFCKKLSELTGAKFDLPTEAQWEYACRAGTTTPFNTVSDGKGEQLGFEQGNYDVNFPYAGKVPLQLKPEQEYRNRTIDVHECEANRWGLKQMHGNVREWCLDDWNQQLGSACQVDPVTSGDEAAGAVLRGGGWNYSGERCRSAYRYYRGRDYRFGSIGLRVAQVLE